MCLKTTVDKLSRSMSWVQNLLIDKINKLPVLAGLDYYGKMQSLDCSAKERKKDNEFMLELRKREGSYNVFDVANLALL